MSKGKKNRGVEKVDLSARPEVPEAEVEDYDHPVDGGHHVTQGYDPYTGSWNRADFGNGRFIPDPWEGPMPPIKRPDDSDHDYDND